MNHDTRHSTQPDMLAGLSNEDLRRHYRIGGLFESTTLTTSYLHDERFIVGGVVCGDTPIALPAQQEPESAKGQPFLERREAAVVNIGAAEAIVTVDGERVLLARFDCLYLPRGSRHVTFEGNGARLYFVSVPAHARYALRKIAVADAKPLQRGEAEHANRRTIYQMVLPGVCDSAQLLLGLTVLEAGSVWNTMPPHLHDRRSEVYFYFGLGANERVFHYMGQPNALRHLVLANEEAVISPPWSVHMGCGTSAYAFIWAMAGENLDYGDLAVQDICQLR